MAKNLIFRSHATPTLFEASAAASAFANVQSPIQPYCSRRQPDISRQFYLRPYERADYSEVFELLSVLPTIYPNGASWLDHRLGQVLDGKAFCTVAQTPQKIVGVTIETPKGNQRIKLSTVYVHPNYRSIGIGRHLLWRCRARWIEDNVHQAHVTVGADITSSIQPLLTHVGFLFEDYQCDRYGAGRDEVIYVWQQKMVYAKDDCHFATLGVRQSHLFRHETLRVQTCANLNAAWRTGSDLRNCSIVSTDRRVHHWNSYNWFAARCPYIGNKYIQSECSRTIPCWCDYCNCD